MVQAKNRSVISVNTKSCTPTRKTRTLAISRIALVPDVDNRSLGPGGTYMEFPFEMPVDLRVV